jgi:hypothetical protein
MAGSQALVSPCSGLDESSVHKRREANPSTAIKASTEARLHFSRRQ